MLHQNVDLYICEHCRLEFYDEEECLEHEKTHSPHFDGSTNEDIAKELDALGANACSFRVGDCVMGMTVHSFKNLMSVAARALRGGADNAGKSEFDKALGELHDLTEWEDAEAAIRELHARGPEIERLYLDSKILPGELRALVMVSNCLEREFIHRQLATGQPLHMNVL